MFSRTPLLQSFQNVLRGSPFSTSSRMFSRAPPSPDLPECSPGLLLLWAFQNIIQGSPFSGSFRTFSRAQWGGRSSHLGPGAQVLPQPGGQPSPLGGLLGCLRTCGLPHFLPCPQTPRPTCPCGLSTLFDPKEKGQMPCSLLPS